MKKRTIIIIASVLISILIIGGIIGGFKMKEQQTKDRQIAFLKAHEQEISDYLEKENSKVTNISYDINKFSVGNPGGFNSDVLTVPYSFVYEGKTVEMGLVIETDVNNPKQIKGLYLTSNY
ncbi:hypothetical protein [Lactovum odontotermitis]